MKHSTALVTGGAGLIGSHLVDLLLEEGYGVKILDLLHPDVHPAGPPAWVPRQAEMIVGDVRDQRIWPEALQGVDVVFHQAAFGGFTEGVEAYFDTNTMGTAQLFDALAKSRSSVRKVVVASSQAVYGEGRCYCPRDGSLTGLSRREQDLSCAIWEPLCPYCREPPLPIRTDEDSPVRGTTPYALSKYLEERLSVGLGKHLDIPVVALRYGVTYGPRQSVFNPYTGVMAIFSTRIVNDLPPVIYEDGKQQRDFIFVKDVARANLFVAESSAQQGVFNVGTGRGVTMLHLAECMISMFGCDLDPLVTGEYRVGDVRHIVLAAELLETLGFRPQYSLEEGLEESIAWIRGQGRLEERFGRAADRLRSAGVIRKTTASS